MNYFITIELETEEYEEFELEVEVGYIPGQEQTFYDPGFSAEVEIVEIDQDDFPVDISWNEMWTLLEQLDDEYLLEKIEDKYAHYEYDV